MGLPLARRQNGDDLYGYSGFWYSPTGTYVRYGVGGAVLVILLVLVFLGYLHARRRQRQGLQPLSYHRWMIANNGRGPNNGRYQNNSAPIYHTWNRPEQYAMNDLQYVPPPPAYNVPHNPPPEYYFAPPAGPPPAKKDAHQSVYETPANGEASGGPQPGGAYGNAAALQMPGPTYASGVYR